MSKKNRHFQILKLIEDTSVESQQDILSELEKEGIHISQSMLSKDLTELGIIKVRGKGGQFRFIQTKEQDTFHAGVMLKKEIVDFLRDSVAVNNLVLIKTVPGNAQGLAKTLDDINWPEIVGTVASVDTLLVVTKTDEDAKVVVEKLQNIIIAK